MSAYMCEKEVFEQLATYVEMYALMHNVPSDQQYMVGVAGILAEANLKSVQARYPQYADEYEVPEFTADWRLRNVVSMISPSQIVKTCHCLAYQSCEYDGWMDSLAYSLLREIEAHVLRNLPGYDDAEWGAAKV